MPCYRDFSIVPSPGGWETQSSRGSFPGGIQRAPQATGCWWIQIHVVPAVPLRRLRKQGILLSSSGCHQHDTQVELGRARHEVAGGMSGGCEEWSPDVRTPLPTFRLPIWFLHLHHRTRRCLASFWWVDHLNRSLKTTKKSVFGEPVGQEENDAVPIPPDREPMGAVSI
jgi:hypothetical protein